MNFEIIEVFNRSVTIERCNGERYESQESCRVYVDGRMYCETRHNVITVDGLEPGREYELAVESDAEKQSAAVCTAQESFLLDVRQFGAVGDGIHDDTAALQAAIASCPPMGTVWLPRGVYLSGPLFFHSHMTLWVDEGATLLGLTDRAAYPVLPGVVRHLYDNAQEYNLASWEGNPLDSYASLVTAIGAEDVSIIGRGTIDGNAGKGDWWVDAKKKRGAWRPNLLFFNNCRNVRVQGVHLQNSPCWCVHPYYSQHLRFLDLTIQNPSDSPNTDGFDPESCEDVLLLGTRISVGDDCIAIKSGKLYMARYHHRETRDVTIRNCRLERGHGSVTVGSEVAGGVRGVHISRCVFAGTDRGVRIKTRRGRGERSVLTDLVFENIEMDGVHMPVTVNMFYFCDPDGHSAYVQSQEAAPVDYRTPRIGTMEIRDVRCRGVDASLVCAYGLPEAPIESLTMQRVTAEYLPEAQRTPERPIMMDDFPKLSGRGLYLRNIRKLQLEDVTVMGSADSAPELVDVEQQEISALRFT